MTCLQRKRPRGKEDAGPYRARQRHPSHVRSRVSTSSAAQKCRLGLIVHSVGVVRAPVKIDLDNIAYNLPDWPGSSVETHPRDANSHQGPPQQESRLTAALSGPPTIASAH